MIRVAGAIIAIAFYIYSIIDVIRSPKNQVRTLPKYVWLVDRGRAPRSWRCNVVDFGSGLAGRWT